MENITKLIDGLPEPSRLLQYTYSGIVLLICIIGFSANTVIVTAILKLSANGSLPAFYVISLMIACCDYFKIISSVLSVYPYLTKQNQFYPTPSKSYYLIIVHFLFNLAYFGTDIFVSLTAFNRVCVIMIPFLNWILFEEKKVFGSILLNCWFLILFVSVLAIYVLDMSFFWKLYFYPEDLRKDSEILVLCYITLLKIVTKLPTSVPILYCIISIRFFIIRRYYHQSSQSLNIRVEMMLVIQGVVIWGLLYLCGKSFQFVSRDFEASFELGSFHIFWFNRIINTMANSCHPFIYYICDSRLRTEVKGIFRRKESPPNNMLFMVTFSNVV